MGKEYILDEEEIIFLYNSGLEVNHIAKKLGVDHGVIKRRLVKNNIPLRNMSEIKKKWNLEKSKNRKPAKLYSHNDNEVYDMYESGISIEEISKEKQISLGTIRYNLLKNNVDIDKIDIFKNFEKANFPINQSYRKYNVNENYFNHWTKSMAYIVGFMSADGYVSDRKYFKICLQFRDRELLEKINHELYSFYSVGDYFAKCNGKEYPTSHLTIKSDKMTNDLINIGVTPRKSFAVTMDDIPPEFRLDFIRGYFDGDGTVGEQWDKKSKIPMLRVRICSGSQKILRQIVEELRLHGVRRVNVYKYNNRNLYGIEYSQNASMKIYDLFFSDYPEIFLKRKKDKFEDVLRRQSV